MRYGFEKERIPIGDEVSCQFLIGSALERQMIRLVGSEHVSRNVIQGAELAISMGRYAWEPVTVLFWNEKKCLPMLCEAIKAHKKVSTVVASEVFLGLQQFDKQIIISPIDDVMEKLRSVSQEQMGQIIPAFYSQKEIARLLEVYGGR